MIVAGYAALTAAAYFGFAIVALVPVVLHVPSRPISAAYRAAVIIGSLAYAWRAAATRRAMLPREVLWPVGLLTVLLLLRMLWDSLGAALPLDLPWDDYWMEVIAVALVPALPFLFVPMPAALALARRLCLLAGIAAVLAIAAGAWLSLHGVTSGARLTTDVIHPIGIGEIGVSLFIVSMATDPAERAGILSRLRPLQRILGGALGAILCVVAASKGPLLSLAVVSIAMFAFRVISLAPRRRNLELLLAAIVVVGLAVATVFLARHGLLVIYDRFSDLTSDRSTALRVQAWSGALAQYDSAPLFGNSFIELSTRFYPHNTVLETMMATGVVGLVLLLLVLALGAAAALALLLERRELSWVSMLFVQHVISGMLSGSVYRTGGYWVSILMVVGAYAMLRRPAAAAVEGAA